MKNKNEKLSWSEWALQHQVFQTWNYYIKHNSTAAIKILNICFVHISFITAIKNLLRSNSLRKNLGQQVRIKLIIVSLVKLPQLAIHTDLNVVGVVTIMLISFDDGMFRMFQSLEYSFHSFFRKIVEIQPKTVKLIGKSHSYLYYTSEFQFHRQLELSNIRGHFIVFPKLVNVKGKNSLHQHENTP